MFYSSFIFLPGTIRGQSTVLCPLTADKPMNQGFDPHGGFVKGAEKPLSRCILAESEAFSDSSLSASVSVLPAGKLLREPDQELRPAEI